MNQAELRKPLEAGIAKLGIELDAEKIDQLMSYLALLIKWNRAFNLTAVRDPAEMVNRHLLDSLSVLPYIASEDLIDVGSGPGLPGVPLAICLPELKVTTLDSNGKKTRFQNQVKAELGLANLTVINSRAEQHQGSYSQVISRAFASLADMLKWTHHMCAEDGLFLAMKGQYPTDELAAMPEGFALVQAQSLVVPSSLGERHLLMIGRA